MDRSMMLDLADLYETDVPISENEAFKARFRDMRDEWEHELKDRMVITSISLQLSRLFTPHLKYQGLRSMLDSSDHSLTTLATVFN